MTAKIISNGKRLEYLEQKDLFLSRHIGPSPDETTDMLKFLNLDSLEDLIEESVPESIRMRHPLELPEPRTEDNVLTELKIIVQKIIIARSFIGMGYHGTITPNVILRNLLENPGWYTAYTPYQAEVSQGTLQAVMEYQTMLCQLTGMGPVQACRAASMIGP